MQRSILRLVASIVMFSFALAMSEQDAFGQAKKRMRRPAPARPSAESQRLRETTVEMDHLLRGSEPYNETVRRYLNKQEAKIVGGKPASAGAFPWQVSLGVSWIADPYSAHFCGGSVYSDRWIITAAHCAEDLTPLQVVITAGTNRLVATATRRNVKRIIVHKDYNATTTDNDVALMELMDPLPLGSEIKSVTLLPLSSEDSLLIEGAHLVVTGWGATQEGGQPVRDLRYLDDLPYVTRATCNRPLAYDGRITENMICAGRAGIDSCQGDSGGPLTVETETVPKLAGIVSWGEGCARPNKFGIYTRVAKYTDWVEACVSGSATCNR